MAEERSVDADTVDVLSSSPAADRDVDADRTDPALCDRLSQASSLFSLIALQMICAAWVAHVISVPLASKSTNPLVSSCHDRTSLYGML